MVPPIVKVVLLGALLRYGSCQRKDSYTDENRPYEFGFTIEGEQHRYEKKDEKGIIMGEYGFITADGVYHVTVYATDENGNFRILKTKNIRIGLKMIQPTTTTTIKPTIRKLNGISGCSGCLIPTTTQSPPFSSQPQKSGEQGLHYNREIEENPPIDVRFQAPQINSNPTRSQGSINNNPIGSIHKPGSNHPNTGNNQITLQPTVGNFNQKSNYPKVPGSTNEIQSGPKQVNGIMNVEKADTPATLLSSRVNYTNGINNNINIPPGSEKNTNKFGVHPKSNVELSDTEKKIMDFMTRLYKFNYTLTFHGHEEEGDIAGNKRGSYFNNGRDGYQRKVVYLANEFGYQPTVSLVKVDDAATPNELTEKDLTELKGNEFIWFIDKTNSSKK